MKVLVFGKGGSKKYKNAKDESEGWPDKYSLLSFASLKIASNVIESLLDYHGVNAMNHCFVAES